MEQQGEAKTAFWRARELAWMEALLARHQASLTFREVRQGLTALSGRYVSQRTRDATRALAGSHDAPLDGRGKRAAFALYYACLHYAVARHVVQRLPMPPPLRVLDLGCGTGVMAAAWAAQAAAPAAVTLQGYDLNGWALAEARWNWQQLGLCGRGYKQDLLRAARAAASDARAGSLGIVLGYSVNELGHAIRAQLLEALLGAARAGANVWLMEPIAKGVSPWWDTWAAAFAAAGGRADTFRLPNPLLPPWTALARAAKLDHRILTARTLVLAPGQGHG